MEIDNTRIIFSPERGYTTSIYNYFKKSNYYYVSKEKEFFNGEYRATEVNNDMYLNLYDKNKIYIDCSFVYFADYIINKLDVKFTKDVILYNLRDLNSFVNSMYITLFFNFLFTVDFSYKFIMDTIMYIYNIKKFLIRVKLYKKYNGEIHFINDYNFNINSIICYYCLPKINSTFSVDSNSRYELIDNIKRRIGTESIDYYNNKIDIIYNMEKYINEYRNKIDILNENNIRILKKQNFILGYFDEELYRSNYKKNIINKEYVEKIVNRLPTFI